MPYRSTKEKAEAQKAARKLYVVDGLSLKEIHQQTGETMRTLRAWYNLGDWDSLRISTEFDRLEGLRDGLLDRAEAQIKAGKLPHTEIGLMYKLEQLIVQRKKDEALVKIVALNTVGYFIDYLFKNDRKLCRALVPHLEKLNKSIGDQDFVSQHHFLRPLKIGIP